MDTPSASAALALFSALLAALVALLVARLTRPPTSGKSISFLQRVPFKPYVAALAFTYPDYNRWLRRSFPSQRTFVFRMPFFDLYTTASPLGTKILQSEVITDPNTQTSRRMVKPTWPKSVYDTLGVHAVACISGEQHKFLRKVIAPVMQTKALEGYVQTLHDVATDVLNRAAEHSATKGAVRLTEIATEYTFLSLLYCVLGCDENEMHKVRMCIDPLKKLVLGVISFPIYLPFTAYYKAFNARKLLLEIFQSFIGDRRALGLTALEQRKDILSQLVLAKDEIGQSLTDDQIKDQIVLFFFAGTETSSSTISSCMNLLKANPHVIDALRREIARAREANDNNNTLSFESIVKNLQYMEATIYEVMRTISPVPGAFRGTVEELELDGVRVPKGCLIAYGIALQGQFCEENEKFIPERFASDAPPGCQRLRPEVFTPFGAGPRNCLGMNFAKLEVKIFLSKLLTEYDWELTGKQTYRVFPVVRYTDGLLGKIIRREAAADVRD